MKLPKIKKLNAKGVSHHVLIAVLVITGIAGFGAWRVFSSSAQTAPVARCSVSAPSTLKPGNTYLPQVTITNTGTVTFRPIMNYNLGGHVGYDELYMLPPGSSVTKSYGTSTAPRSGSVTHSVQGLKTAAFSCSKTTTIVR